MTHGLRYEVISTVTTPAATYDLTDLTTVHDELSIPATDTGSDGWLGRAITQASTAIRQYCNQPFVVETLVDTCYLVRSPYGRAVPLGQAPTLQLRRWPLISVTSVIETAAAGDTPTALVLGSDYIIRPTTGELIRINSTTLLPINWIGVEEVVTYQAGYTTIPADVVDATLRLVTARYRARGRDPMLRTEGEPGLGQQQYWVGSVPGQTGSMAPEIASMLDSYRVPLFG